MAADPVVQQISFEAFLREMLAKTSPVPRSPEAQRDAAPRILPAAPAKQPKRLEN